MSMRQITFLIGSVLIFCLIGNAFAVTQYNGYAFVGLGDATLDVIEDSLKISSAVPADATYLKMGSASSFSVVRLDNHSFDSTTGYRMSFKLAEHTGPSVNFWIGFGASDIDNREGVLIQLRRDTNQIRIWLKELAKDWDSVVEPITLLPAIGETVTIDVYEGNSIRVYIDDQELGSWNVGSYFTDNIIPTGSVGWQIDPSEHLGIDALSITNLDGTIIHWSDDFDDPTTLDNYYSIGSATIELINGTAGDSAAKVSGLSFCASDGYEMSFILDDKDATDVDIWVAFNATSMGDVTGARIRMKSDRLIINVKEAGRGWINLTPAKYEGPPEPGDRITLRVADSHTLEVLRNESLQAKYYLGEAFSSEGIPAGTVAFQVSSLGSITIRDFSVNDIEHLREGFIFGGTYSVGEHPYLVLGSDDLDGDGHVDLIVTNRGEFSGQTSNNTISILYGKGDGTFEDAVHYVVGQGPYTVVLADVNENGQKDIIVASFFQFHGEDITILLNDGPRSYTLGGYIAVPPIEPLNAKWDYWPVPGVTSLAAEDFNNNGHIDLTMVGWTNEVLYVYEGDGTGNFTLVNTYQDHAYGYGFRDIKPVDINKNGDLDLIISCYTSNHVTIFKGNGDNSFTFKNRSSSGGVTPYHLNVGDFNNDGYMDFVVGNYSGSVKLFINENDDYQFSNGGIYTRLGSTEYDQIRDVVPYDFTGDGVLDLVVACRESGYISILYGTGDFTEGNYFGVGAQYYLGKGPRSVFVNDYNGNGVADLAVVRSGRNAYDVMVLLGRHRRPTPADGAVLVPQDIVLSWVSGAQAQSSDVYLGTSRESVRNGDASVLLGNVSTSFFSPELDWQTQYFWRVDEIYDSSPLKGKVWSFTVDSPICDPPLQSDLTGNCRVGIEDFFIMASEWLMCTLVNGRCF